MEATQEPQPKGFTWSEKVSELQAMPDRIRNLCILAHVDHGKTSLADSLISSNSIISQKLAGSLRYLDSRQDEQERQITMKASSISLLYQHQVQTRVKNSKEGEPKTKTDERNYLINLMDSPGHVDFSSEVSSALRLADGAIVLVDVIEGVSPQTYTVLRQAWEERVKVCLVLNKIDRLIVDRAMSGQEIFTHLNLIIEQVNSIIAELISKEYLQADQLVQAQSQVEAVAEEDLEEDDLIEKMENECFFCPEKGNVAFSSALDCWAFTLTGFSKKIAQKLGMNPKALQKYLWGEFYYDSTNKKITRKAPYSDSKEMFVQFVMEPLVKEYKKLFSQDMVVNSPEYRDARNKIKALFSKWMPLEKAVLGMIVQHLPSPQVAQKNRIEVFCPELTKKQNLSEGDSDFLRLRKAIEDCNQSEDQPLVTYIAKMQPYSSRLFDILTRAQDRSAESQRLIAFARVFSGKLKVGQKVLVMGPKHQVNDQEDVQEVTIQHLFLLMGSSMQPITEAPAGCIVGIGGLEETVLKTATVSSSLLCPNFTKTKTISLGIVKVAIETKELGNMELLKVGLEKLNRADPSVQFFVNSQGEYILSTCGEVHLDRCIRDLKDDFAPGIEMQVSDPIIAFKETIINYKLTDHVRKTKDQQYEELTSSSEDEEEVKQEEAKTMQDFLEEEMRLLQEKLNKEREFLKKESQVDMYLEKILQMKYYRNKQKTLIASGYERACDSDVTANQKCKIKIRAVGLHFDITKWLEKQSKAIMTAYSLQDCSPDAQLAKEDIETSLKFADDFKNLLLEKKTNRKLVRLIEDKLACFGPKRKGPNLLINKFMKKEDSFFQRLYKIAGTESKWLSIDNEDALKKQTRRLKEDEVNDGSMNEVLEYHQIQLKDLNNAFVTGFDIATNAGPLCLEPMLGACFIVEKIEHVKQATATTEGTSPAKKEDKNGSEEPKKEASEDAKATQDVYGPFAGQVIRTVKEVCQRAFLNADPRIVEGVYLCDLQALPETYGKVYGVINKCRGRVVKEEVQEGTNNFLIEAVIPVMEGFVFNDEIRKKACGIAYPQLVFYGWEINDNDPFFIPKTDEEMEEHGEGDILPPNPAKVIVEKVRVRKGLPIDKKIVVAAEQQRTLSKKK